MSHVVMVLDNPYTHDVRVQQEARCLVRAGHRVTVIGWDRQGVFPREEVLDGVTVKRIRVRTGSLRSLGQVPALTAFCLAAAWQVLRLGPDSVHANNVEGLVPALMAKSILRRPVVYDAAEAFPECIADRFSPGVLRIAARIEETLMRQADEVVTVSERLAARQERRGAKRVTVVGNWKDPADYRFSPEEIAAKRTDLRLDGYRVVATYLGMLSEGRCIAAILGAARRAPDVGFVLGGPGPMQDEVERASRELTNLRFIGCVASSEVPLYTVLGDVGLYCLAAQFPNNHYSAPNKLFEALAAGTALLVCEGIGDIAMVVDETGCGVTVAEPTAELIAARLQELADHPAQLAAMKERARELGRTKYHWQIAERRLLALHR